MVGGNRLYGGQCHTTRANGHMSVFKAQMLAVTMMSNGILIDMSCWTMDILALIRQ